MLHQSQVLTASLNVKMSGSQASTVGEYEKKISFHQQQVLAALITRIISKSRATNN